MLHTIVTECTLCVQEPVCHPVLHVKKPERLTSRCEKLKSKYSKKLFFAIQCLACTYTEYFILSTQSIKNNTMTIHNLQDTYNNALQDDVYTMYAMPTRCAQFYLSFKFGGEKNV